MTYLLLLSPYWSLWQHNKFPSFCKCSLLSRHFQLQSVLCDPNPLSSLDCLHLRPSSITEGGCDVYLVLNTLRRIKSWEHETTFVPLACHRLYSTTILLASFLKEAAFMNVCCAHRQILCDLAGRCKWWQVVIKLFFYISYQQGSSRFLGRKIQEIQNALKIFLSLVILIPNHLNLRIIFIFITLSLFLIAFQLSGRWRGGMQPWSAIYVEGSHVYGLSSKQRALLYFFFVCVCTV